MNQNIFCILLLVVVLILVKIIIKYAESLKKSSVAKKIPKQLEFNEILDYITDLCIDFDGNNREQYTNQQLTVISAMEYYDEMMNGGLYQFFANSSRIFAPILSASLEQLNAKKHKTHFNEFIKKHKIDVDDLDLFISDDVDDFMEKYEQYPFEEFDMKFYHIDEEEDLCNLIIDYAKKNFDMIFKG